MGTPSWCSWATRPHRHKQKGNLIRLSICTICMCLYVCVCANVLFARMRSHVWKICTYGANLYRFVLHWKCEIIILQTGPVSKKKRKLTTWEYALFRTATHNAFCISLAFTSQTIIVYITLLHHIRTCSILQTHACHKRACVMPSRIADDAHAEKDDTLRQRYRAECIRYKPSVTEYSHFVNRPQLLKWMG